MKAKAPTLAFALAAVLTIGVVILMQAAPARAARDVAMGQFTARVGDCITSATMEIAWPAVEEQIRKSEGRSGWIEGAVYVGPIADAAASRGAEVLASDSASAWIFRADEKRLMGLTAFSVDKIQGYVVTELSRPC
jgi:hypothetical protein